MADRRGGAGPSSRTSSQRSISINIALHTDHCQKDNLDTYVRPLIAISQGSASSAGPPRRPMLAHVGRLGDREWSENLGIADGASHQALARTRSSSSWRSASSVARRTASSARSTKKLHTTPEDALRPPQRCSLPGEQGRYLLAATFGNVHGVYKPGSVPCARRSSTGCRRAVGAETRKGQALRPRVPWRLRVGARGDSRGAELRRGEDERRHRRRAVRVHP